MAQLLRSLALFLALALCAACAPLPALAAPAVYTVAPGPGQSARFDASTQTEHYSGHTDQVSGTVTFDAAAPIRASARIQIALSSLSTSNSLRDLHMRRLFLQTEQFPTATFQLTQIVLPAAPALGGSTVRALAQGTLTLHGVTRPIAAPVDVTRETSPGGAPGLHLVTRFVVRLADYKIRTPRFLFFVVRQEHTLSADLHAVALSDRERPAAPPRNTP